MSLRKGIEEERGWEWNIGEHIHLKSGRVVEGKSGEHGIMETKNGPFKKQHHMKSYQMR